MVSLSWRRVHPYRVSDSTATERQYAMKLNQLALAAHRRTVQYLSLVLLHSSWGPDVKWFCNPVLTCHSCALAWFACPVGVFVHYSGYHLFPFLAAGTVLFLGVLGGRILCGWVCPFGLLQDLLYRIPSRKFMLPQWTNHTKYLVLALMVLLFPFLFGEQTLLSFCRVCPASAIEVTLPNLARTGAAALTMPTAIKLGVLAGVVLLAIACSRSFCRVFCPIGALLAPLNYVALWKIQAPAERCISCKRCDKVCPGNGAPSERIAAGVAANRSLECIVCHECQTACPMPQRERKESTEKET